MPDRIPVSMKLFYSRRHALEFLDVQAATLQHAVDRGWIRTIKLGPTSRVRSQFFLHLDLIDFRRKYRSGYFEPSAVRDRSRASRRGALR